MFNLLGLNTIIATLTFGCRMRKAFYGFLPLLFCLAACGEQDKSCVASLQDISILLPEESIVFPLDSASVPTTSCIQYIPEENKLTFINELCSSIYEYDYRDQEFLSSLDYSSILPKVRVQGYLLERDTLFLYEYYSGKLHKAVNGRILSSPRVSPVNKGRSLLPAPYVATSSPIIHMGSTFVFSGFLAGESLLSNEKNRPVMVFYDEKTNSSSCAVNYPSTYSRGNWGGGFKYRMPYYTTSLDSLSLLVSFPAASSVVLYNLADGTAEDIDLGSSIIRNVKPYSVNKRRISNLEETDWYMRNPSYESVYADPYRRVYYRIARLPDPNYRSGDKGNRKPVVLIVFDEDYSRVGEYLLPDKEYRPNSAFVTEKGLNVQVLGGSEDELVFDLFVI